MKWNHVGIKCADIQKSLDFYQNLLGLKLLEELELFGKKLVFVGNESISLELEEKNPDDTRADPTATFGLYHICFTVDNVKELVENLEKKGIVIRLPPFQTRPDRWTAFVEDPDGVFIQFIQYIRP